MSAVITGRSTEGSRRAERDRSSAKDEADIDIKNYAETTMNELLGWYGYDKLDSHGLNLKNLNIPTSSSSSSPVQVTEEDLDSEEDTVRSKSPEDSVSGSTGDGTITCAWCLKTGLKLFTLKTNSGKIKAFCSETCFNQCRRAAFKKNRVCNWCRHVRHTVNYVDFKDGDDQLQFCSDKCLNQYKMQIFCKETQAYLQMNPHLKEEPNRSSSGEGGSNLITPDLWLRDCHESMNGGLIPAGLPQSEEETSISPSGEVTPKSMNGDEIEDLTLPSRSKSRHDSSSSSILTQEKETPSEQPKNQEIKEKRNVEIPIPLAPYVKDERIKSIIERKKRHSENDKDHLHKRPKSHRHRVSDAPPAHMSSTAHLSLPYQNKLYQSSSSLYPPPSLNLNSSSFNPPAAHSKPSLPSHTTMPGPSLMASLPPPPPLLNNDFLHSPLNSFFPPVMNSIPTPQQFDAILRMRHAENLQSHLMQDSALPMLRNASMIPHAGSTLAQPNVMMMPYPIIMPFPVPIPIPLPTTKSSPKISPKEIDIKSNKDHCFNKKIHVNEREEEKEPTSSRASTYTVTNLSKTNRMILARNRTR